MARIGTPAGVRHRWLACLAAATVALAAAPAVAVQGWTTRELGPGRALGLAIDAGGSPWVLVANAPAGSPDRVVRLAVQGALGAPDPVPSPNAVGQGAIASDVAGRALVAWIGRPAGAGTVSVAARTAAGWGPPAELDRGTRSPSRYPAAVALAGGPSRSVAVWVGLPDGASAPAIRASWRDGADGTWTPPVTIATGEVGDTAGGR